jgi:hypothetical protein
MNVYLWLQECKSVIDRLINAVNQSAVQLVLRWGTMLGPMVFPFWGYALALPCQACLVPVLAPAFSRACLTLLAWPSRVQVCPFPARPSHVRRRVPFLSGPPPASAGTPAPFLSGPPFASAGVPFPPGPPPASAFPACHPPLPALACPSAPIPPSYACASFRFCPVLRSHTRASLFHPSHARLLALERARMAPFRPMS